MENSYNSVNEIINEMKRQRKYTESNIVLLICIYFALFCEIEINSEIDFMYLKYKVEDKFKSNEIAKAYNSLIDYFFNTKSIFEFEKIAFENLKKEEYKRKIELLINELGTFPNYSVTETSEMINSLCVNLLKPKEGSFYDGASGLGTVIVEACEYSDKINAFGQESNVVFHSLSVLRMYLHEISAKNVVWADTIEEPMLKNENNEMKKFDFSVMFPPLNVKTKYYENEIEYDNYNRFLPIRFSSLTMEWFFVQHQIATLKDDGIGVAVVPSGCLYNTASEYIRKEMVSKDVIECIISLPPNMLTYTTVPINLIVFKKRKYFS